MLQWRHWTRGDFCGKLQHLRMNHPVRGQDCLAANGVWLSLEIADRAARFFDQHDARGGVPWLQAKFPEAVEIARRRRRPGPTPLSRRGARHEIAT